MSKLKIGNHELNLVVDDTIPPGTVIFQNPKTGKEISRIVNIAESDEPLNDVLTGIYEAQKQQGKGKV